MSQPKNNHLSDGATIDHFTVDIDRATHSYTISRRIAAPPRLVWETMLSPKYILQWYPTSTVKITECKTDIRDGGEFRVVAHIQGVGDSIQTGHYDKVVEYSETIRVQKVSTEITTMLGEMGGGGIKKETNFKGYMHFEEADGGTAWSDRFEFDSDAGLDAATGEKAMYATKAAIDRMAEFAEKLARDG